MKILNTNTSTRKTLLDKTYACELSGWQIAAITLLCNKFAAGSGENCLRRYCDEFSNTGDKLFPFIKHQPVFDDADYFLNNSSSILLEE